MSIKTFWAAEVRCLTDGVKYVGAGGRLMTTPQFYRSHKILQQYLTPKTWLRSDRYAAGKHASITTIVKLLVNGTISKHSSTVAVTLDEFMGIKTTSAKTSSYGDYCAFRLCRRDGTWVAARGTSGRFGKIWHTAGSLRRHLGDHIYRLTEAYAGATVHVTVYDKQGVNVIRTIQVPAVEFFIQSPIYRKKWEEINTPTTLSAGRITGRLSSSELV